MIDLAVVSVFSLCPLVNFEISGDSSGRSTCKVLLSVFFSTWIRDVATTESSKDPSHHPLNHNLAQEDRKRENNALKRTWSTKQLIKGGSGLLLSLTCIKHTTWGELLCEHFVAMWFQNLNVIHLKKNNVEIKFKKSKRRNKFPLLTWNNNWRYLS